MVLKESEAGAPTKESRRRHGISEQSFYRWEAKYGGMDVSEAKRLRALEDENGLRGAMGIARGLRRGSRGGHLRGGLHADLRRDCVGLRQFRPSRHPPSYGGPRNGR